MNSTNCNEVREIVLTKGVAAIVDAADYGWLNQWKWHALTSHTSGPYAARWTGKHPHRKLILMHILIANPPSGVQVDHHDRNPVNNRRSNLRLASNSQNGCNRKLRADNTSGVRGVSAYGNKWRAQIQFEGKHESLGYFATKAEAAKVYREAAARLHGEFAARDQLAGGGEEC